jgi:hypothetical protein
MYALPSLTVGPPSRWMRSPGRVSCHTARPVSAARACSTPPLSWCRPSPKITSLSVTAGDDTLASLSVGVERVHAGFLPSFIGRSIAAGLLNAPNAEVNRWSPTGTGAAMKWSCDATAHSTAGVSGPGLPSVLPVRCGLPR